MNNIGNLKFIDDIFDKNKYLNILNNILNNIFKYHKLLEDF